MRRSRAVKQFLVVLAVVAVGAVVIVSTRRPEASLQKSTGGEKVFEVRLVRGPYTTEDIQGVVALEESTGCYIVWTEKRVEVYRVGWSDDRTFDCVPIWAQNFEDIRGVVPVGDGTTSFVVYTKNNHYVFKADWFSATPY